MTVVDYDPEAECAQREWREQWNSRKAARDWSKLRIVDGVIHYRLYQQDGTMRDMTAADTIENRMFVEWVQIHDSYSGAGIVA